VGRRADTKAIVGWLGYPRSSDRLRSPSPCWHRPLRRSDLNAEKGRLAYQEHACRCQERPSLTGQGLAPAESVVGGNCILSGMRDPVGHLASMKELVGRIRRSPRGKSCSSPARVARLPTAVSRPESDRAAASVVPCPRERRCRLPGRAVGTPGRGAGESAPCMGSTLACRGATHSLTHGAVTRPRAFLAGECHPETSASTAPATAAARRAAHGARCSGIPRRRA
jgi:hypothetical protein